MKYKLAKNINRIWATIIDTIIIVLIASFIFAILNAIYPNPTNWDNQTRNSANKALGAFSGLIADFIYTVVMLSLPKHSTFGQRALGIMVIKKDGAEFGFGTSLLRYLISIISSVIFKIGYAVALFTKDKQTLHDLIAGTIVVTFENKVDGNKLIISNNDEEIIWSQVANELSTNIRNEGLWARCFAEADGDEGKAKAMYLKKRVEQEKLKNLQQGKVELQRKKIEERGFEGKTPLDLFTIFEVLIYWIFPICSIVLLLLLFIVGTDIFHKV